MENISLISYLYISIYIILNCNPSSVAMNILGGLAAIITISVIAGVAAFVGLVYLVRRRNRAGYESIQ